MKVLNHDTLVARGHQWFTDQGWQAFPFQEEVWRNYLAGKDGLLNAPTGSGKTYALWMPCLLEFMRQHPADYPQQRRNGLRVIWITPLRALAKDIQTALQRMCNDMEVPWAVGLRTGDTAAAERQRQKKQMPECLITTPESLHLMLSQKGSYLTFKHLEAFVVDEWHELLGSKRGVQVELALARLRQLSQKTLRVWGVSATIGNLPQASEVLLGTARARQAAMVRAQVDKALEVESILPDEVEKFPWAGHQPHA